MTPKSADSIRATTAAHAHAQPSTQPQAQSHRPGEQVAHYKGATLRTAFAMVRPGGMAKAMLAKLKPRPAPSGADREGGVRADGVESALDGGSQSLDLGDASEGEGRGARQRGGHPHGSGQGGGGSSDDGDEAASPRAQRARRARPALTPLTHVRTGAALLRAEWATTAMASGGEAALQRALATRLFHLARGPGTTGWRKPWLGDVGALYAAAAGARFDGGPRGMAGVRELLAPLSAEAPANRLLHNPMRATFFCLLPLVLLDLQRPRTRQQREDLLVRLAALARMPETRRPA